MSSQIIKLIIKLCKILKPMSDISLLNVDNNAPSFKPLCCTI